MRFLLRTRGETTCVRCQGLIINGETYVERETTDAKKKTIRVPLHPECALDVDTTLTTLALARFDGTFEGIGAFRELAQKRSMGSVQRVAQRRSREVDRATGFVVSRPPTRPREDDPYWVSPALDHRGRPRVRVLVAGSGSSMTRTAGRNFRTLLPARSWASPKREYVFVTESSVLEFPDNDPAQPILGALYMPIATSGSTIEGGEEVCTWSALGVPAPILWLIGVSSTEPRDAHTIRFRELMDDFGYDGDQCVVLCAPRVTADALDRLVRVMDEAFDGTEVRCPENPWATIAERLRDDIRAKHEHRYNGPYTSVGQRITPLRWTRDTPTDMFVTECASMLVERDQLDRAAEILSAGIVTDHAVFERWFARWWHNSEWTYTLGMTVASVPRDALRGGLSMVLSAMPPPPATFSADKLDAIAVTIQWQGTEKDEPEIQRVLEERAGDSAFLTVVQPAVAQMRARLRAIYEWPEYE